MDLNRVSAFARVVRAGSFTAAAKALGLPKSSISRSVAQLEQDLGIRLLHRTTRQLHLTDAGAAYYDRVARALVDIDEATVVATDTQAELRGAVRVTAPPDLGIWALGPIVRRFVRKHPRIRVEVSLSNRIVDLAAEGFDLALRAGALRDTSLIARKVGSITTALYASRKYVERHGAPDEVKDLERRDCVLFRPVDGKSTWELRRHDGAEESVSVTGAIASDDMSFVRKVVMAGAGIGMLPDFLCAREEQSGRVVRVLPEWSFRGALLHVVYPSARFVPQRVVVFREFMLSGLAHVERQCEAARAART
ncbi:MAG: LysR family transcriptional regulator [Labilithrix sp.]|nr:LysR family transcriptional regulator [Labilithrix sp.]